MQIKQARNSCIEKMLLAMDLGVTQKIGTFLFKFIICEASYKSLATIVFQKRKEIIRIDEVKYVVKQLALEIEETQLIQLFGSNKEAGRRSNKTLRNEIVHNLNKNSVSEVIERYSDLCDAMDAFIQVIIGNS